MRRTKQLEKARAAKSKAKTIFKRFGNVTGIGITRIGGQYAIKVNFEKEPVNHPQIPTEIDGIRVVVFVTGEIRKQ